MYLITAVQSNYTHLFDGDADSDRVDGTLNENLLLVITTDDHRLKQQLFAAPVITAAFSILQISAEVYEIRLHNRMWQVPTGQSLQPCPYLPPPPLPSFLFQFLHFLI